MSSANDKTSADLSRRDFFQLAGRVGLSASAAATVAATEPSVSPAGGAIATESTIAITRELTPEISGDPTTADLLVDTLIAWGVSHVFGVVGDGINPIIEALRKRRERITYVGVRHEEAAAFMACGWAKHTGRIGACIGTTGPGAVHLLNGLYDAHFDGAPVVAITGTTFHDLIGTRYQQSINTTSLMRDVALYNVEATGPQHMLVVANLACRAALGERGVAHLTISKDVQLRKLSTDERSKGTPGMRGSSSWLPPMPVPPSDQLRAAAAVLNGGNRTAVLVGQGALAARAEVVRLAELRGAPVAKALLGKAVLPDDSPYTTGGIGNLGTAASSWIMQNCDTVLILGSTMPWYEYYPRPGQARGVQVDMKSERLGLRYPVEIGLTGDVKATLQGLLPLLRRNDNRTFLAEAQQRMRQWNQALDRIETTAHTPLRPQMVIRALSDQLADDAIVSLDCGANTYFAARHLKLRANQSLTGTGMLASMAPGMSYAIAAKLAYPERQSVAVMGDGGFAMLMAELTTAVALNLPIKVIVLKNNSLGEVMFEQRELGNPTYGVELSPIDFVAFAQACGAEGFRCTTPAEVAPAIAAALRSSKPALVEAWVDANEKPAKPSEVLS